MSRDKFFPNPYLDYTPENAKNIILDKEPHPEHKICKLVNEKWQETTNKFQYLDYNDNSVYTGTAGVALLKLKQDPNGEDNLKEILQLLLLHRLRQKRHTFLCGDTGPLAIGAVAYHKLGKTEECKDTINRLLDMKKDVLNVRSDLANEYLYGRAGYLFAIIYVNKNISPPPFEDSFIRQIIEAILICGQQVAKSGKFKCPLMYQWHDSFYLGAAHGLTGILYLLLQNKQHLTEQELSSLIKPTIDYLITLRFPSGNYPSSVGRESDKYVQWCHGAPGFLYLFTTAYKVYNDRKYLQLAEDCGNVIWERGLLRKGYSLCHGVAGNAYCFLELFQTTQDRKHLYRAIKFTEWCIDYTKQHENYPPDRPLSLYEGICGRMYLLLDIQNPLEAKFPGFTI